VRIGFICEGKSELRLIKSQKFRKFLSDLKLDLVKNGVRDAKGCGNLLPENIEEHNNFLKEKEVNIIIILADLEIDKCITKAKQRIKPDKDLHKLIISRNKIESWFLSNDIQMKKLTGKTYVGNTEKLERPDNELGVRLLATGRYRAIGHADMADIFIDDNFDIQNSNCESAKYFIKKLKEISETEENKIKKQTDIEKSTKPISKTKKKSK